MRHDDVRSPSSYRPSEGHSSDHRNQQRENNGLERPQRRESCRSPQRSSQNAKRSSSPHRNRSRSPQHSRRSPQQSRRSPQPHSSRSDQRLERDEYQRQTEEYPRNTERLSSDRRSQGGTIFDRMSSPPQSRRYGESSRGSADLNSNGHNQHFVRTVNNERYEHRIEPHSSDVRTFNGDPPIMQRYQIQQSPHHSPIRYVQAPASNRVVLAPENIELRALRERLLAAEQHGLGLTATIVNYEREIVRMANVVRSYEREINKLQAIVSDIVDDYNSLQRNRWMSVIQRWSHPNDRMNESGPNFPIVLIL